MSQDPLSTGSLTASCRAELATWHPPHAEQADLQRSFRRLAESHEQPWARSTHPGHLTASTMICNVDASQVLLILHPLVGRWIQTGGHIEADDDSLPAAALREAREESGISGLSLLPGIVQLSEHPAPCRAETHLDVRYVAVAPRGAKAICSDESIEIAWFSVADLPADLEPEVIELIMLSLARVRKAATP